MSAGVEALRVPRQVSGARPVGKLFGIAAAAVAVTAFAIPALTGSYWTYVFTYFLVYAMIGLSLVLLTGYVGQISLMGATLVGLGAFTSAAVEVHWGWPFWAAALSAGLITLPFSLLIGFPALRLRGLYLAIATLAFAKLIEELVFKGWPWLTGGFSGMQVHRPHMLIPFESDARYFWLVLGVFCAVLAFTYNFSRSRVGRAMRATRENELAAQAMGINIVKYKMLAFFLSGVVAGLAGALQIHLSKAGSFEAYRFYLSFLIFVMVVIGGVRSMWGALLGGVFLILQTELLRGVEFLTRFTDIAFGVGLIWVVLSNPEGLAGYLRDQWAWVKEKPRWRALVAVAFVAFDIGTMWLLVHFGGQKGAG
ncbi:MAG: branched-chain amino acid ABC transporter permease [Actinomycetota bacterium]